MLYLVATPIGNLKDLSFRALEVLRDCDYILCEDSRHSQKLLHHFEIKKSLISFHKFNEQARAGKVLDDLKEGKTIVLISDAGTPGIADPGERLVRECIENNLPITALPGPCAAITALTISGLTTERFQFCGFLPRKFEELKNFLSKDVLNYPGTSICYEAPPRLLKTLIVLSQLDPLRIIVVAREITKMFEEVSRGRAEALLSKFQAKEVKGEIVLLIAGKETDSKEASHSPQEIDQYITSLRTDFNFSKRDIVNLLGLFTNLPKPIIYKAVHQSQTDSDLT